MVFSKTAEYAIRVLSYFAINKNEVISASFLHEKLDIPYKYLTRIMTNLAKGGFLEPIKGRIGGFVLCVDPAKIYLSQIVEAIDNYDGYDSCVLGFAKCDPSNPCVLHEKWEKIRDQVNTFLRETTLKDFESIHNFRI